MRNGLDFFTSLSLGIASLQVLMTGFGLLVCLAHRKISVWMHFVAAGFAGLFAAGVVGRVAPFALKDSPYYIGPLMFATSGLGLVAWALVVFGLAATFHDVRRAISLVKDRHHDLE